MRLRGTGRDCTGNGKEAGLHDGVHMAAHAGLFGQLGIDGIELEFLLDDILLDFLGQLSQISSGPNRLFAGKTAPGLACLVKLEAFEEGELVAGHEVGGIGRDQKGGLNGFGTKAQMDHGQSAGLLKS